MTGHDHLIKPLSVAVTVCDLNLIAKALNRHIARACADLVAEQGAKLVDIGAAAALNGAPTGLNHLQQVVIGKKPQKALGRKGHDLALRA